jgi:ABC-type nitrate/sulfonate/bicarbonate transport system substrate-binding protein
MKTTRFLLYLALSVFTCFLFYQKDVNAQKLTKIRIGWQVPWATQGQLVQILKHTDILKQNGLTATFVGRTYGPVLNEIALAGDIDVVFTADQPAAALFSKEKGWIGIGRLMYNRTLTYVPPNSPIQKIKGLRGKTMAKPSVFRSAPLPKE